MKTCPRPPEAGPERSGSGVRAGKKPPPHKYFFQGRDGPSEVAGPISALERDCILRALDTNIFHIALILSVILGLALRLMYLVQLPTNGDVWDPGRGPFRSSLPGTHEIAQRFCEHSLGPYVMPGFRRPGRAGAAAAVFWPGRGRRPEPPPFRPVRLLPGVFPARPHPGARAFGFFCARCLAPARRPGVAALPFLVGLPLFVGPAPGGAPSFGAARNNSTTLFASIYSEAGRPRRRPPGAASGLFCGRPKLSPPIFRRVRGY
jgi:hypothetical protein